VTCSWAMRTAGPIRWLNPVACPWVRVTWLRNGLRGRRHPHPRGRLPSAGHSGESLAFGPLFRIEPNDDAGVGAKLGVYEILSHLGAGGMGEVYLPRDTKLARDLPRAEMPSASG
jgi:hypothetical protein